MSVKYLSSKSKEGDVASLRVSSSFYVAPQDAEPPSAIGCATSYQKTSDSRKPHETGKPWIQLRD